MPAPRGRPVPKTQTVSDQDLINSIVSLGVADTARRFNITERGIYRRKAMLQEYHGARIKPGSGHVQNLDKHPSAIQLNIEDGHVLIGSDSHYWPGVVPTAHEAFLEFCREYKPKVVIKNGDEADFSAISRHGMIGWENRPKVSDEVDNLKAMLSEVEKVSPKARHVWPLGNHDSRFETRLASVAPEYANIHGVHLKDNFPKWEPCWLALINRDTVVKHRFKSGIHAPHNNTLWAGRTMVTGHLHKQQLYPLSDYNGTRWGLDCGCMADCYGEQFTNYTELNPLNWRSGFALLTFVKGKLLMPELVWVSGPGTVQFRGKEWSV